MALDLLHREHAMVLWQSQCEEFDSLLACHYLPSEGIWSDQPVLVLPRRTSLHRIAMDDAGNALALWVHSPRGAKCELQSSFFQVKAAAWREPESLARAQAFTLPHLVMAGGGEALARWREAAWSAPSRLGPTTQSSLLAPRLALCPQGAVALWTLNESGRRHPAIATTTMTTTTATITGIGMPTARVTAM